jgi:hypothetical protein
MLSITQKSTLLTDSIYISADYVIVRSYNWLTIVFFCDTYPSVSLTEKIDVIRCKHFLIRKHKFKKLEYIFNL